MKKLVSLIIMIPVGIILIVLSVANRNPVTISLDPFKPDSPAISFTLPLFALIFIALICGMVLGSMATWWRQGKHRKNARSSKAQTRKLQQENEQLQKQLGKETPKTDTGLPILTDSRAA